QSLEDYPFSVRLANAVLAYCVYIGQTLWPVNLGMFYPHPAFTNQSVIGIMPWTVAGTAVCLLATTAFVCVKGRAYRYLPVGWFWYLGTLVPVIGLVQVGAAAHADRYTYVPLVGLFIVLVWGIADWAFKWHAQKPAFGLGVALLFILA